MCNFMDSKTANGETFMYTMLICNEYSRNKNLSWVQWDMPPYTKNENNVYE